MRIDGAGRARDCRFVPCARAVSKRHQRDCLRPRRGPARSRRIISHTAQRPPSSDIRGERCWRSRTQRRIRNRWDQSCSYAAARSIWPRASGSVINLSERKKDEGARQRFEHALQIQDPNARFHELGKQTLELYSYDLATTEQEIDESEPGCGESTWEDMVRLQNEGVYPAAFAAIKSPVLMLHGAADPHPGEMIRASLAPYLPQLEYREWERCGHYPWLEKATHDEFFSVLRNWLPNRLG